MIFIYLFT